MIQNRPKKKQHLRPNRIGQGAPFRLARLIVAMHHGIFHHHRGAERHDLGKILGLLLPIQRASHQLQKMNSQLVGELGKDRN